MFGINYLNFQFGSPDQQLAILFAGVLAAGQHPAIEDRAHAVSTPASTSSRLPSPSSDRIYGADGRSGRPSALLTWPLSTGFNLGWQATPFQKATFQYQFRFDGYVKDRTTADSFEVPSSTVTQGLGGAWEYRRGGLQSAAERHVVRPRRRGSPGACGPRARRPRPPRRLGPTRSTAGSLSRDFYLSPFQKIHLNGGWFSGRDLDRFVEVSVRDVRRHADPRRAGVRRAVTASWRWCAARIRSTSSSSTVSICSSTRRGAATTPGRGVWDPMSGFGVARQLAGAMEYDSPRRPRQERAAVALRRARFDDAPDPVAEAARDDAACCAPICTSTPATRRSAARCRFLGSRDCYSPPADVYRVAKARGMDLVAFTDHDSIDGALELLNDRRSRTSTDVIIGEEVSCRFPDDDIEVHLAVYGMTESLHRDLQPLRGNVFDVTARLREAGRVLRPEPSAPLLSRTDSARPLPAPARRGAGARGAQRRRCSRRTTGSIERIAQQTPAVASPTGRFGVVARQRRAHAAACRD